MSDRQLWKRGEAFTLEQPTRRPCWAIKVETVLPAGPPPMTTTSALP